MGLRHPVRLSVSGVVRHTCRNILLGASHEYTRTLNGVMKGESRIHTHSFVTHAAIFYWERVTLRIHTHSSWSHEERVYRLHSLICVTYATHDTSSLTQNTRYSHSPWRVSDIHSLRVSVTQDTPCVYMHTHSQ